jgi:hypothetical protein
VPENTVPRATIVGACPVVVDSSTAGIAGGPTTAGSSVKSTVMVVVPLPPAVVPPPGLVALVVPVAGPAPVMVRPSVRTSSNPAAFWTKAFWSKVKSTAVTFASAVPRKPLMLMRSGAVVRPAVSVELPCWPVPRGASPVGLVSPWASVTAGVAPPTTVATLRSAVVPVAFTAVLTSVLKRARTERPVASAASSVTLSAGIGVFGALKL